MGLGFIYPGYQIQVAYWSPGIRGWDHRDAEPASARWLALPQNPYGLKTSTEENRKGYLGFPTICEQNSKLTVLEIWSVSLNRSIWFR